jgi:PhnB protein
MPTVITYLAIDGAAKALEFYKKAFGAEEITRNTTPEGKIIHASMRIGNSSIMMSDIFPGSNAKSPLELGTSPVTLHINSDDVDALWNRALAAGATVSMPLENQYWGSRYGQLVDPFGHHWSLSMEVKMSKEERETKQKEAMEMFSQNRHPGVSEERTSGRNRNT